MNIDGGFCAALHDPKGTARAGTGVGVGARAGRNGELVGARAGKMEGDSKCPRGCLWDPVSDRSVLLEQVGVELFAVSACSG